MKKIISIADSYKICILLLFLLMPAYVSGIPAVRASFFVRQTMVMILLTMGVSLELIGGTFDLAFAAQISFSTLAAMVCMINGGPLWLGCLMICAVNAALGCLKGIFLVGFLMPSIIFTLALQMILTNLSAGIASNSGIVLKELQAVYKETMGTGDEILLALSGAGAAFLFLERTYYGKYSRMLGENLRLAKECGLKCMQISIGVHLYASLFFSAAAILLMLQTGSSNASLGENYLYRVLTAAFLGNVGPFGGRGKVSGMTAGAVIMVLLIAILTGKGYLNRWETILEGLIILIALWAQRKKK